MSLSNPVPVYVTAAVSTVGVIGGAYLAYRHYQEKQTKLPDNWVKLGQVTGLYAFPIKSCAAVMLDKFECTTLGLRDGWLRDRSLMVIDAKDNNFITARVYPELIFVQPTFQGAVMTLQHPKMENSVRINLAEVMLTQKPMQATVWQAPVPVYDCGEEVNQWLSKLLNREDLNVRLVYYASEKPRKFVGVPKVFYKWKKTDTGAFPDQLSYNLVNQASVDDLGLKLEALNTRLNGIKVDVRNFRPNMLLTGAKAYDEDNWKFVKIGENIFEVVKPCTRCVFTTIDPETGIPDKNKEPIETLKSYRLVDGEREPEVRKATGLSPRMGLQLALRSGPGGIISVNEPFYVSY